MKKPPNCATRSGNYGRGSKARPEELTLFAHDGDPSWTMFLFLRQSDRFFPFGGGFNQPPTATPTVCMATPTPTPMVCVPTPTPTPITAILTPTPIPILGL